MMKIFHLSKMFSILAAAALIVSLSAQQAFAQGQGHSKGKDKKAEKKLEKEAKKLERTAEKTADQLGRDVVFCILDAHTDVGTAQELRTKYNDLVARLGSFPFGQFVAAVLMADRTDIPLDEILAKLEAEKSLGQIAKEARVDMGDLRRGFGQFRSELARSMTNPPTRNCFEGA
ncbi:MAG: hypothetical protein AB1631_31815 [Acidobacteriota bacterium]